MRNTKINMIVSFIMSGLILVVMYCLNRIHTFLDDVGIEMLIAGILFLIAGVGILGIEYIKNHKKRK